MKIFLVQHGEAFPSDVNPQRPLTEIGFAQVKRMAEFLRKLPDYPEIILHSDKMRAIRTAEVVSFALGGIRMEQRDHINPNDDTARMIEEIGAARKTLMIAGHMPFLGRLAARLLFGDERKEIVDMANASPLILVKKDEEWVVDTYIKNDYIR